VVRLPVVSGKELIRALRKAGFEEVRRKGSHVTLRKGSYKAVVPLHKELSNGTLMSIMKQCGITKDDLLRILGEK